MRKNRMIHLLTALLLAAMLCPAAAFADYSWQLISPEAARMEYSRPILADDPVAAVGNLQGGTGIDINNDGLVLGMYNFGLSDCSTAGDEREWDWDFLAQPFVWDPVDGLGNSYNDTIAALVGSGYLFRTVYDINNNGEITGYKAAVTDCMELPIDTPFVLNSTGINDLWLPGEGPVNRFNFLNKFLSNDEGLLATNLVRDEDALVMDAYLEQKYLCAWNVGTTPDPSTDPVPYLGGTHDHPLDINNRGIVVGWANLGAEVDDIPAAFAYDSNSKTMTTLPAATLPGDMVMAAGINDNNTIVGINVVVDMQYVVFADYNGVVWKYNEATSQWEEPIILPDYEGDSSDVIEAGANYTYAPEESTLLTVTFTSADPGFPASPGDQVFMNLEWISTLHITLYDESGSTVIGSMTRSEGDSVGDLDGAWQISFAEPMPGIGSTLNCEFNASSGTVSFSFWTGTLYVTMPLGIADNEKILGLAVQMIGNDQAQTFGEGFPILWEPDGMGGWNEPVKVANLVTGLPDPDELSLTIALGEILQNVFVVDPQGVRTVFAILSVENLFATRMSDDGQWILTGALVDDARDVTLDGTYSWDGSGLVLEGFDITTWYNQDPMRLHYDDTIISCSVDSMNQMTLTVNDTAYNVVCDDSYGTDGDITGVWTVTDTGYTMTFRDDLTFFIDAGDQQLKKLVQVALHDEGGGPPCCTEETDGQLDILPACQTINNLIRVPIQMQSGPNDVRAMGFDVVFTPEDEPIDFLAFEPGELLAGWMHNETGYANLIAEGRVRVGAYSLDNPLPEGTSGIIGYLVFEVPSGVRQCISFDLENLVDDLFPVPAGQWSTSGGCLSAAAPSNGDLNNDGQLTPRDALCAFQRALTGDENTFCGTCSETRCDVTQDCECTAADALCIFRAYLMIEDECAQRLIDGMAG